MLDSGELPNLRWTKLNRPRVGGDVVRRARARERLERGLDHSLTLVCAPAGYGKTTLLSVWLADSGRPYAWLSLDEGDSDLAVFLSYFVAAIRTVYPAACTRTLNLLRAPQLPPPSLLLTTLANDLDALPPCEPGPAKGSCLILVLDDYHLVNSEAVHTFLGELWHHPPRAVHLVLSTRQDPPLPLTVLRARGELSEVRVQELRFTSEEIALFMQQSIDIQLDEQAIAILAERTEGWPAGLRLAALTLLTTDDIDGQLAEVPVDNRYVMDYLMGEVLSHIPVSTQDFLLKTSILDRLSGPLCDAVAGMSEGPWDGRAYLEWLAQKNLFTWSVDPRQQWYRYHNLFRSLLRSQLGQHRDAEEIAQLHVRASAWFAGNGFVDAAIEHALSAGDVETAIALVDAHRHEVMNQERWLELERWLGLLPRGLLGERLELVMAQVWLLQHRASLPDIPSKLDRARALLQHALLEEETRLGLQGEIDALASQLTYWMADVERTLSLARRSLAETPLKHLYVRSVAWLFAGLALQMRGEARAAIETLHEGIQEGRLLNSTAVTRLLAAPCFVYWITADLPNLLKAATEALDRASERDLPESVDWAHYFLGCAHYQQNDLASAARDFGAVVADHKAAHGIVFPQSAFGLASTFQAQGLDEQARRTVEPVAMYALEVNSQTALADAGGFAAHLAWLQGREAEASAWAVQANRGVRAAPMPLFYAAPFSLAEILLAQGTAASLEEAARLLTRLREVVQATHNTRFLIETLALQALLYDARRERSAALEALRQAVALAEPGGVIRVFVDQGPKMAALLHSLAAQGGASAFIAKILDAFPAARSPQPALRQAGLVEPLSERELEVLALLAQRLSNKEIAHELSISPMTVKRHTVNIYQKLLVQGRREAVTRATALGILAPLRG